jgi:hypothetical protein
MSYATIRDVLFALDLTDSELRDWLTKGVLGPGRRLDEYFCGARGRSPASATPGEN